MPTTATTTIRPAEARRELAGRELARRHLIDFSEFIAPMYYHAAKHHRMAADYLEQVLQYVATGGREGIGRLLILEPPRHGKSEQVSRHFPAWALGKLCGEMQMACHIIITSYGADLAVKHSRACRDIVVGERYRGVFGALADPEAAVMLSEESHSAQSWELAAPHRGGMTAAGVGGALTGMGANILIVDDPFKNREEASSDAHRERVWEWWTSTAYTRLEAGAAVVGMLTRWDMDDWAGRLLKRMGSDDPLADQWTVLCLPGLALEADEMAQTEAEHRKALLDGIWLDTDDALGRQPSEALWPERYDRDDLLRIRANLDDGEVDWWSLYQQMPRPLQGAFFSPNDFGEVDVAPEGLMWARYVDLAISESRSADFNATVATALGPDGTLYLRDMIRCRGWLEFRERLKAAMLSPFETRTVWGLEATSFQVLALMELLADPTLANVAIMPVIPQADKMTRARPLQTRAKAGKVKLVKGPWTAQFITEAVGFPKGHDDQIDTADGGLQMLAELAMAEPEGVAVYEERVSISAY